MPRFQAEPAYTHGTPAKTAVLLVNLGTPDAPTAPALRKYLKQFLSDRRLVEIPKPILWLILNGIILNLRPKKSAEKYASIWTPQGSPLKLHTEAQTAAMRAVFASHGLHDVRIEYAMRYGSPGIDDTLDSAPTTAPASWCCPSTPNLPPAPRPACSMKSPAPSTVGAISRPCAWCATITTTPAISPHSPRASANTGPRRASRTSS